MPINVHFDLIARFYDTFIFSFDATRVKELLQIAPGELLLDAGGGTGRIAAAMGPEYRAIVCDLSMNMLQEARQKGFPVCCARVEALPFADDAFKNIVMVDTCHHLPNHIGAARELLRVLHPNGRLVVEEPDIDHFGVKLIALGEKLMLMGSHFFRVEEMTQFCNRAGGHVVHVDKGMDPNIRVVIEKK